jgi:hypothetical protein
MTKIMNANASNNTETVEEALQDLREQLEEILTILHVRMYDGFHRDDLDWSEAERLEKEIEKLENS